MILSFQISPALQGIIIRLQPQKFPSRASFAKIPFSVKLEDNFHI